MKIYFGIDCAPGSIRPSTYAERVFEKLRVDPIEAYSKLFGAWEWEVDVDDNFDYESFKIWMKTEMDELYNTGRIRGAQWDKVEGEKSYESYNVTV